MRLWFLLPRLGAAALLIVLAGCGSSRNEVYIEKPVDDLYNKAMDALVDERYSEAAKTFEQVESQHPYSVCHQEPADGRVFALRERQLRPGDHRRRPFHSAASRPPRRRLCVLSEGDLLLHADRRCRPRPADDGARVARARRCSPPFPREQIR